MIRPHHIIESIKNPQRAIREIKYRYTFTSKIRFIADLLSLRTDVVLDCVKELSQTQLSANLNSRIKLDTISSGRGPMGDEAEILYLCVSLIKPRIVVETGVGAGFSTAFILHALEQNKRGELYSIDFFKDKEKCGWIIPTHLKTSWRLINGLSEQVLKPLLEKLGPIDIFIHDSDHSYENMMSEFRTVWPFLRKEGVFLAHDVGRNDALFNFCREVNFPWWKIRTYKVLAGFRKS